MALAPAPAPEAGKLTEVLVDGDEDPALSVSDTLTVRYGSRLLARFTLDGALIPKKRSS